jgi:hypothetical protein
MTNFNGRCRVCDDRPGVVITLAANRRGRAREWRLRVCRDCWRVWEALLEEGSEGTQYGLSDAGYDRLRTLWFL